jgi:hypothetical protein
MKWTQLSVMDFGTQPLTTMQLFTSLARHVLQLNSLAVGIPDLQGANMCGPACAVAIFKGFLRSVAALKELRLDWAFTPTAYRLYYTTRATLYAN